MRQPTKNLISFLETMLAPLPMGITMKRTRKQTRCMHRLNLLWMNDVR